MAEKGARPNVPRVQRLALRAVRAFSSPLLPDDYLELINPLWSTRELRGKVLRIEKETESASTVVIKPSFRFDGHEPGQYLRIGIDIKGRRHWRACATMPPQGSRANSARSRCACCANARKRWPAPTPRSTSWPAWTA